MSEKIKPITELTSSGTLDKLVCMGFVLPSVPFYRDVYYEYDILTNINGLSNHKAQEELAVKFDVDDRTIRRALKFWE